MSPGKFQRSWNIGSESAEFVKSSDSIVTLTHSEGQHRSLSLRVSELQKPITTVTVALKTQDDKPAPMMHFGFTIQLELRVKPCLFQMGRVISHHLL